MFVKLILRNVIKLAGNPQEIKSLLQNISTDDINLVSDNSLVYTLFLTPDGRFLFDSFIFIKDGLIHLDCAKNITDQVINHIKKYKARIKIDFEVQDLNVFHFLGKTNNSENGFIDQRSDLMGFRVYDLNNQEQIAGNDEFYHSYRFENSIIEGSFDMKNSESIPIYFKMHEMNAISLNKGCYLGQESVNRFYRTSEIRKSLVKLKTNQDISNLKYGNKIYSDEGVVQGIICSIYPGNKLLALLNLGHDKKIQIGEIIFQEV
jgi:folate-binding protein YgfZ